MTFSLLYVPTLHFGQEIDDIFTFKNLGINYFSTGHFRTTNKIKDYPKLKCPMLGLNMSGCRGGIFQSDRDGTPIGNKNKDFAGENKNKYNIWSFTTDFLSNFDTVLFCHFPHSLKINLEKLQDLGLKIIIKTFGMQPSQWEKIYSGFRKDGIYIIRNSPAEKNYIKEYCGHDAIIRGSAVINEKDYGGWYGYRKRCISLASNFGHSEGRRRRDIYENIMKNCKWPMELWGAANQNVSYGSGFLSHSDKIKKLKSYRTSLSTGTPNANLTFGCVENFLLGVPQIIFNKQLWGGNSLEESLFTHNKDCILISNPNEGAEAIDRLMKDKKFANKISRNAAKLGKEIWGREKICGDWAKFFNSIGLKV